MFVGRETARWGTPTPNTFPKALPCKWEAYSHTNRRRTALEKRGVLRGVPFNAWKPGLQRHGDTNRDVLPYKLEVYCTTVWTSCTGWGLLNIAQKRLCSCFENRYIITGKEGITCKFSSLKSARIGQHWLKHRLRWQKSG